MDNTIHCEVALANPHAEVQRLQTRHQRANFVSIESYLAWLSDEEINYIIKAVADLPELQTFRISFSFQKFRQLPVLPIPGHALVSILESKLLETLTLDEATFKFPDFNDVYRLVSALEQAPRLKIVTLFNFFPLEPASNTNSTTTRSSSSVDSPTANVLARALCHLPSLQELNLIFTRDGPAWICALLRQSCSSHSMQRLRINVPDGSFLGQPIQCLCQSLQTNSVLQELSIRCPLDENGGNAVARALNSPLNRLEQVYIQLKHYDFAIPIAEALHTNRCLKSFELRVWTGGDRAPLLHACERMVLHNPVLQELVIDNGRLGLTALIDFYLLLNLQDRRQLLECGDKLSPKAWIDSLGRQLSNVSGLFYTLSLNPTLCGQSSQTSTDMDVDYEDCRKRQRRLC